MNSLRARMIVVAVMACLFALGMAALLSYFKYRSTADRIVNGRLIVIGKSIENSIQASVALGIAFDDLGTLTGLMERERAADGLIAEINVFDAEGKPLYSTDQMRMSRTVPASWLTAARRAGEGDWAVEEGADSAVGMSIKNNFGLTLGYLALRYSRDKINDAAHEVGKRLALAGGAIFAGAALLAWLALSYAMRPLERDIRMVEGAIENPDSLTPSTTEGSPFGPALVQFFDTVRDVETELSMVGGHIGHRPQS